MSEALPISHSYNLNRLGQAGDEVAFAATDGERGRAGAFRRCAAGGCLHGAGRI